MEMRLAGAAVVLVGFMAASAWAGENAKPVSPSTLEAMGLGQMQTLEDSDGARVRGKFTFVRVRGFSRVGGTISSFGRTHPTSASGFRFVFSGGGFAFGGAFGRAN